MKSTTRSTLLWFFVGVLVFFTMAASSPQCARSTDQALNPGVDALAAGGNICVQNCIDALQAGFRAEKERYRLAKEECNGDYECLEEEAMLNIAIKAELVEDKDMCIVACEHEQGEAVAGQ
jgi:hypothetical protein